MKGVPYVLQYSVCVCVCVCNTVHVCSSRWYVCLELFTCRLREGVGVVSQVVVLSALYHETLIQRK